MDKVIRDGKVAVLYSPGYGSGWYSWNTNHPWLLFDPPTVNRVLDGRNHEIGPDIESRVKAFVFTGGAGQLSVAWLPVGTRFVVEEYDGNESIRELDAIEFHIA